jgi:Tol biopolymer transport system component
VLQQVSSSTSEGGAQFDFSQTGLLTYLADAGRALTYPILAVDRNGTTRELWSEPGSFGNPRLSPDGKRLSLTVLRDENWDVWVYDLERTVATRLTFGDSVDSEQIWSPDGEYLIFSSDQDGPDSLYRKRADGSGDAERLTEAEKSQWGSSWSRDGRYVAFIEADTGYDLWYLDLETGETREILTTQFGEGFPDLSPDGRLMAYASNESGSYQIYVRPFPDGPGKWQVSDSGGSSPRWSRSGRELFWRTNEGIAVADVETAGGSFRSGKARQLFSGAFQGGLLGVPIGGYQFADFDVSPDGQWFVMFPDPTKEGRDDHQHITLVTRWFEELERIPRAKK